MLHGKLKYTLDKHIGAMTGICIVESDTVINLNTIDEVKINTDTSYKLDVALKLKDIHKTILDGESISRVISAIIIDGVKFTKLEISALDKLNTVLNNGNNIYFGTKPAGYDLAVNTTMLGALTRSLKDQRNTGFDTMVLERYIPKFESGSIKHEEDNLLIYSGIHTYLNMLKLSVELLGNVLARANSNKY